MFEGRVFQDTHISSTRIIVDAEPYVMSKIRKIFDNANNYRLEGRYTHKPISFIMNLNSAKDILWIMERYQLEIEPDLLQILQKMAAEYDDIIKFTTNIDKNANFTPSEHALELALPLEEHQIKFLNMFKHVKRMLLADVMGLGKTVSGISTLQEPTALPALVVVSPNLCTQWERELKRFLPNISTHVIKGFKTYELPQTQVLITSYNRLAPWQDILLSDSVQFKTIIFDEIQELRHLDTGKRFVAHNLSLRCPNVLGLSGTPIYNLGVEIWSVMDVIKQHCLGDLTDFKSEWCDWNGKVREPLVLNSYLKKQGLLLRRTPQECGRDFGKAAKYVYTLDSDIQKLKEIQNIAKMLAVSILSGNIQESSEAAKEFDWRLRHATGVAKAKPVAEFVKMMLNEKEKIILVGWHRECYSIWAKEFAGIPTVMYTGSESPAQKDKAVKDFVEGDAKVFIISLQSGAGLDGLQKVCNTVVFGELHWSPHVMDQVLARVDRQGQTNPVQGYYLTIPDGSDPFMINLLSVKRAQHEGVIEGKNSGEILETAAPENRFAEMAKAYLESIGEEIPEPVPEIGLLGDVVKLIRKFKLPNSTEAEMQDVMFKLLKEHAKFANITKEYSLTARSRLDFLIENGEERVAIECKINNTKRTEVYRQVRRYVEEGNITSLILVAPWTGIASFKVDNVPVIVIDPNINSF